MKFKDVSDRARWESDNLARNPEANTKLKKVIDLLDRWNRLVEPENELIITSYIRLDNPSSYHWLGQAVDVRTNDRSDAWYAGALALLRLLRSFDDQIQNEPHRNLRDSGSPNQHIHVEIDDGGIKCGG